MAGFQHREVAGLDEADMRLLVPLLALTLLGCVTQPREPLPPGHTYITFAI